MHTPAGFDPSRPFAIVVFLHGWTGCVRALVEGDEVPCTEGDSPRQGWGLGRVHDAANANSIFVVPQLRYLARSGAAGRYREATTFRALLDAALRLAHDGDVDRAPSPDRAASIVLVAHSAGFETALAILEAGDLAERIDSVLLLDALYRGSEGFAHWVASHETRRMLSLYTGDQSTYQESHRLARLVRGRLGDEAVAERPGDLHAALRERRRVVVGSTRIPHGAIPRLSLPELLQAWGLPPRGSRPMLEP
ncbi:MAG: hypothetical protein DRJ42_11355 [Deltaproteobacteria bacterium]|nr:MAG: hypothetical protein DRJ42_11355 [Deltaproteobacteria bacterium]